MAVPLFVHGFECVGCCHGERTVPNRVSLVNIFLLFSWWRFPFRTKLVNLNLHPTVECFSTTCRGVLFPLHPRLFSGKQTSRGTGSEEAATPKHNPHDEAPPSDVSKQGTGYLMFLLLLTNILPLDTDEEQRANKIGSSHWSGSGSGSRSEVGSSDTPNGTVAGAVQWRGAVEKTREKERRWVRSERLTILTPKSLELQNQHENQRLEH